MSSSSERIEVQGFDLEGLAGEWSRSFGEVELDEVRRVIDPSSAVRTVHWGRNYLYEAVMETATGSHPVVVKSFRDDGWRRQLSRRLKGTKARRSWLASLAFLDAGVAVPRPIFVAESRDELGPSYFVCTLIPDALEARYLFRAMSAGTAAEQFPEIDVDVFLGALGAMLRRLHDAGAWHRDVSAGNVLLTGRWHEADAGELYLLDLNRARVGRRLTRNERMRDLARLPLFRKPHRERLLGAYFARPAARIDRLFYAAAHFGFHNRHRVKGRLRGVRSALAGLRSRGAHAHIPPPEAGAEGRERVVWDGLSDQPHLHAGRWAKARERVADSAVHVRGAAVVARTLPRTWRCYRALRSELYRRPVPWGDLGIGVHAGSAELGAILDLVEGLATRQVLQRVHVWEGEIERDVGLARELRQRGCEVVLAVPQNRELVRDAAKWREALEQVRDGFEGLISCIQVGHAINRSKWGVWNPREHERLLSVAGEVFGDSGEISMMGPAVIDFEFHQTALALNWGVRRRPFDVVSSLLYVDRRGAPENEQAGLDTVDKITLLRAIIQASRDGDRPSWITEVNWPLREGPHSPAGRQVSVDERRQADYLVRYMILGLGTGLVERIYWWQLVAKGYGLVDTENGDLRPRAAYAAMRGLQWFLRGGRSLGPLEAEAPVRLWGLEREDGSRWVAAWRTSDDEALWQPPAPPASARDAEGNERRIEGGITLSGTPLFLEVPEDKWPEWHTDRP
jgi:tRNA A-37 threonylcarbamoyl transferase component Bud32